MLIEDLNNEALADFVQGFCPHCHSKLETCDTLKSNCYCPDCDFETIVSRRQIATWLGQQNQFDLNEKLDFGNNEFLADLFDFSL